jgi:hypothetical protein
MGSNEDGQHILTRLRSQQTQSAMANDGRSATPWKSMRVRAVVNFVIGE